MARPTSDPSKQRRRQVGVRMNPAEWQTIEAAARARGVTVTAFLRDSALTAAVDAGAAEGSVDRERGRRVEEAYVELRRELRRLGNNINQLTRLAHIGSPTKDLLRVLGDLQRMLARVLAGEGVTRIRD